MKKFIIGLLSLVCAVGLCVPSAVFASAAESAVQPHSATLTAEDLNLLLPERYEQYLALDNVTGVTVRDGYIAVANGNVIYLYNGVKYLTYKHSSEVAQLEMNDSLTLYFLDRNGDLHTMDCTADALQAEREGTSCSSFTLAGNTLYYARSVTGATNIYEQSRPTSPIDTLTSSVTAVPCMTYANGKLYYTDGRTLNVRTGNVKETYSLNADISNIAIQNDTAYYTDKQNLYSYSLSRKEINTVFESDNVAYTTLTLSGNYLYVAGDIGVKTKICRFDTKTETFDDYEIATSSNSQNRLVSAKASIVNGDYLITADQNRLSLYNYGHNSFTVFPCAITPQYLASDGKSILVADANTVYAYDFTGKQLTASAINVQSTIRGVACAKGGDYMLVTRNNCYYRLDATDFSSKFFVKDMVASVLSMNCDLYGNLYVEYSDNVVYKYTEEQFLSTGVGERFYEFSTQVENISVDFDGNVYGFSGNTLYCSDGNRYLIDGSQCLFLTNSTASLQSFAFGYEHSTVYFVYDDYILSTEAIALPNLNDLEAGDSYKTIFETSNVGGVVSVATLRENATLLHFSLEELDESDQTIPYLTYSRTAAGVNALVLGETEIHGLPYYIVTVFNAKTRQYTAGLVLQDACKLMNESAYASAPKDFNGNLGYITNDVLLYKYPYMTETLTVTPLAKNALVTVLKELSLGDTLIDYDYYYVSYADGENVTYGYVPKNFVRDFVGIAAESQKIEYKTLKSGETVTAVSQDNRTVTLQADKEYSVVVYTDKADDETVLVAYEQDGITYYANVAKDSVKDASLPLLRYFIVILLVVLDILIIVNYCIFRKKK